MNRSFEKESMNRIRAGTADRWRCCSGTSPLVVTAAVGFYDPGQVPNNKKYTLLSAMSGGVSYGDPNWS